MRTRCYPSDLTDAQWALMAPHIPAAKSGGRPRTTNVRAVFDAIIYLLRTGCQWRQLPSDFPPWPTVHGYFRSWRMAGVWALLHRALYTLARLAAGRKPEPTLVIMDGRSGKTAERGGVRGFDGHKRVKGRKRHILVDILGLPITNRVEPANISDRRAGGRLFAGLAPLWPTIRIVIADAGHESAATLPGVRAVRVDKGEVVADADRETLIALMTTLRDVARFAFELAMDICGVGWPQRAERFDVVYNLLSVSLNQRRRANVTTDESAPVPSVHTVWPVATWWEREAWDLFWQTGDATLIDGVPNGLAELTVDGSRQAVKIQTGSLAVYAFVMLIGVGLLIAIFLVSR